MKTLVTLAILMFALPASARFVERWDYEKLSVNADVILIATPLVVTKTEEQEGVPSLYVGAPPDHKQEVAKVSLTSFSVQAVLKGVVDSKQVVLRHLRGAEDQYPGGIAQMIRNVSGPSFVAFTTSSGSSYLMFLKKLPNGQYVSVTGQTDPGFGIKKLSDRFSDLEGNKAGE